MSVCGESYIVATERTDARSRGTSPHPWEILSKKVINISSQIICSKRDTENIKLDIKISLLFHSCAFS
jgi:hypothetical protein